MAIVCFVLFSEATHLNTDAWREQDTHTWSHGASVAEISRLDEEDATIFYFSGDDDPGRVVVKRMGEPMELAEVEDLPGRTLWPDDQLNQLTDHQDHWIIASQASESSLGDQALMVTQVADAILRSHPNAVGVIWGDDDMLRIWSAPFQEIARTHQEGSLPTMLWIATTVIPDFGDGSGTLAMTSGMEAFGLMEIECIGCSESPEDLLTRLQLLSNYLIENGPVIGHGDTIGDDEDEQIQVIYGKSFFGREGKVMHLRYPDVSGDAEVAVSQPDTWIDSLKGLAVIGAFLLAAAALIFGIVWGMGALRAGLQQEPAKQAKLTKEPAPRNRASTQTIPPSNSNSKAPANPKFLSNEESLKIMEGNPYRDIANGNNANGNAGQRFEPSQRRDPGERFGPSQRGSSSPRFGPRFPPRGNPSGFQPRPQGPPAVAAMPSLPTDQAPQLNLVGEVSGLDSPLRAIVFSNDSKQLAYATSTTIALHDATSMQPIAGFAADARTGGVTSLAFRGDRKDLIAGTNRGQLRHWTNAGNSTSSFVELKGHEKPIVALALNSDATLLVSLDRSGQLMWQRLPAESSDNKFATVDCGLKNCQTMTFDESTMSVRIMATGSYATVDLRTRKVDDPKDLWGRVASVSQDGKYSVTVTANKVLLGDVDKGYSIHSKRASDAIIEKVGFIGGQSMFFAMGPSQLDVWDITSGKQIWTFDQAHLPRPAIAISPDGNRMAIGTTTMPDTIKVLGF